jgi:hypothetical protein
VREVHFEHGVVNAHSEGGGGWEHGISAAETCQASEVEGTSPCVQHVREQNTRELSAIRAALPLAAAAAVTGGDFLVNGSQLALGIRQNGLPVNDVVLPPWAGGPEELLAMHR